MSQPLSEWSDEQINRVINKQFESVVAMNFIQDPAMVLILLEKLPNAQVTRLPASRSWAVRADWTIDDDNTVGYGHRFGVESKSLGRAVCEAYIQAHGLEGK